MSHITTIDYTGPEPVMAERPLTPEEDAQRKADAAAAEVQAQAEADALAAREAAIAKLAALGLTVDDLAALGL